jgi:hypothetical protein
LRIVSKVNLLDWKNFLKQYPSTVYHTPEWKQVLVEAFSYTPVYLYAINDVEEITGFLPLFQMRGASSRTRLCSVPFGHLCGPLGSKQAQDMLLKKARELVEKDNLESLEIRESVESSFFKELNSFSTFILDLEDPLAVWNKLDRGSVRWAIKRASKMGVKVEATNKIEDIRAFYELNCLTKRDIGVPCHPWPFFEVLFNIFKKDVQLYLAKSGGSVIGGGVFLYHNDTVLYGYGAADPKRLREYPYNAFIWESIKDACAKGYSSFDFGRTSYTDTGLLKFKRRWGGSEKKLFYSYFPTNTINALLNRDSILLPIAKECINILPLPLYKEISNRIFPFFG